MLICWWRNQVFNFFYKQPFYRQLALAWEIAKQLSWLNPLSLSNEQIKEKWSFSFAVNLKWLSNRSTPKFSFIWKNFKISDINVDSESWDYCIPCRHRLPCQTTKQPLGNFEPQKLWKYKQLWGLRSDPSCL